MQDIYLVRYYNRTCKIKLSLIKSKPLYTHVCMKTRLQTDRQTNRRDCTEDNYIYMYILFENVFQ